jgi:hypothetical protein
VRCSLWFPSRRLLSAQTKCNISVFQPVVHRPIRLKKAYITRKHRYYTMLLLFMSIGRDYVSELRPPTGQLFISQMIHEYVEPRWNDIDRGKPKTSEKILPSAILSTINLIWTKPGANPGLRGERPATNRQSHGRTC